MLHPSSSSTFLILPSEVIFRDSQASLGDDVVFTLLISVFLVFQDVSFSFADKAALDRVIPSAD